MVKKGLAPDCMPCTAPAALPGRWQVQEWLKAKKDGWDDVLEVVGVVVVAVVAAIAVGALVVVVIVVVVVVLVVIVVVVVVVVIVGSRQ